jgi:hypothetical protein
MRPYTVLSAVILMAVAAFGQRGVEGGYYGGGYAGPFMPLATTPEFSLQSISPNPVGASNATTGLIAGATNGTLSQINGSSSSEYPVAVWTQGGGAPVTTSDVQLYPERVNRDGRLMHSGMMNRGMEEHGREEFGREKREEKGGSWTYYSGRYETSSSMETAGGARTGKKASRTYTNDDIARENDKNGNVKHNGKTEKI